MKLKYVIVVTALLGSTLRAQMFKGHQIGESTADFLKSEPFLRAKLADCQATAPRELTPEEIRKSYGKKIYEQYMRKEGQFSGEPKRLLDKDPDVYGDKCAALVDTLDNSKSNVHIDGNGYNSLNVYYWKIWNREQDGFKRYMDSSIAGNNYATPPPPSSLKRSLEINEGNRGFYFDNGALSALYLSVESDYKSVRDDVTSRLGVAPGEVAIPYQNAFGAKWENVTAFWNTEKLRVELSQENNPAKPSLPQLSVRSQALYRKTLEHAKGEPKPLDRQ